MVANYVDSIGVKNPDETYSYKKIGIDSDHVEVDSTGKTLTTEIEELESKVPDVATATTAGIVKPGDGLEVAADGTLDLSYDHTLTLTDEDGTVIGSYDGSADKTVSVATIPTDHASTETTYGIGTTSKFGHVKIVDTYKTEPGSTSGTVASASALYQSYVELKRGTGVELTQAQYDALTPEEKSNGSSYYVDDSYDGTFTADNIFYDNTTSGLTSSYVKTAIDELCTKSYTPKAHSADTAEFGAASSTKFGHSKLSDLWQTSGGNADSGIAASSYALNAAYNELSNKIILASVQYKDITADYDSGSFSSNLSNYAVGNYIKKIYNEVTYVAVLAHYNYFYNPSNSSGANINQNTWTSIVLGFPARKVNDSSTTDGGFLSSSIYNWLIGDCETILTSAFGESHLVANQRLLTTGTYDQSSALHGFNQDWTTAHPMIACLMSEVQIFGTTIWSDLGWSIGEANRQLNIFKTASYMEVLGRDYGQSNNVFNTSNAQLRDIGSKNPSACFCVASNMGCSVEENASTEQGCFPIINLK